MCRMKGNDMLFATTPHVIGEKWTDLCQNHLDRTYVFAPSCGIKILADVDIFGLEHRGSLHSVALNLSKSIFKPCKNLT